MQRIGLFVIAASVFVSSAAAATPTPKPSDAVPIVTPQATVEVPEVTTAAPSTTPSLVSVAPVPAPSPTPEPVNGTPTTTPAPPPSAPAPAPSEPTCTTISNKDRLGFDLTNFRGQLSSCDDACRNTKNCTTWTWNDYNGGTCWLKTHSGKLVDKAGVTATECTFNAESSLVCSAYKDIDFVGMDIASRPGAKFEDCCDVCNEYAGCTAYAWTNFNGGTCWLKKSVGHVVYQPGVISSSIVPIINPVCPFEYDVDFIGNDIGNKPASDAGKCCDLCRSTKGCGAYTWSSYQGGTCWMKSDKGASVPGKGLISAKLVGL